MASSENQRNVIVAIDGSDSADFALDCKYCHKYYFNMSTVFAYYIVNNTLCAVLLTLAHCTISTMHMNVVFLKKKLTLETFLNVFKFAS